ncbi:MAG: H-NS histone family protein [Pseudomonadota bacterium]
MAQPKLDKMTLSELEKLRKDVDKAIATHEKRRLAEARAAVEAKAKEMGFSLMELTGAAKSTAPKSAPKYAHPENPTTTWTGRGRRPEWVKQALAAGKALEDLAI